MSRLTPEEFHNYVVTLSGDEVKRIDLRLKNLKGVENIINGELKLEAQLKSILNSAKNSMRQVLTSLSWYHNQNKFNRINEPLGHTIIDRPANTSSYPDYSDAIASLQGVDHFLLMADRLIEKMIKMGDDYVVPHLRLARKELGTQHNDLKRLLADLKRVR